MNGVCHAAGQWPWESQPLMAQLATWCSLLWGTSKYKTGDCQHFTPENKILVVLESALGVFFQS